jgi:hypothetical protein
LLARFIEAQSAYKNKTVGAGCSEFDMRYVNSSSSFSSISSHDGTGSPIIRNPAPVCQLELAGLIAELPVQIVAIAMLIPNGVLRLTPVATTSFRPEEGLLSAG